MGQLIQGTAVQIHKSAVLIIGKSGVGKTALALKLIEQGATLISDDFVEIENQEGKLLCLSPKKISGKIELRGIGVIQGMPTVSSIPLVCIVQLHKDKQEVERCPQRIKKLNLQGKKVPLFDFFSCEMTYLWVLYALKILNKELTLLKE